MGACREEKRARRRDDFLCRGRRQIRDSGGSLSEARELIDDRQDNEPWVGEGDGVRVGWIHVVDGRGIWTGRRSSAREDCTRAAWPLKI